MKQEKSSRTAVIAGPGADTDIPDGMIGKARTGRARAHRIRVIVRHRPTSAPVSAGSAPPASGQLCSTGARSLLNIRLHAFRAPSSDAAERGAGPT
ncbi:hypothetical protein ACFY7Y_13590 [Streptomyces virginiae]|uniref:hypothetical protein n=1 Tax=Streptomyces virginiae TaxID=1961 RepID=UPI00369594C7